jgi:SAM-dependent methyltransferase
MDSRYADHYRKLYEQHWWWRARESLILSVLRGAAKPPGRILDIGCGDGLFFDRLAEFGEVEGVEADPSLVDPEGPHRARIHVRNFDADFRPSRGYGLILMLDVLEHLPDPLGALRHALELLDDDGTLLITVPAFRLLWTAHDDWNHHYTRYTKRSFATLAQEAGLSVRESRYFFHWTFPVKLAVRMKEAMLGKPTTPEDVPGSLVNRGLYALSRLEQRMLARLPVPFGSSLMIVAGKNVAASRLRSDALSDLIAAN